MAYLIDNMEMPEPATFHRAGALEIEDDHYGPVPSTSGATNNHGTRPKDATAPATGSSTSPTERKDSYVSFSLPSTSGYADVDFPHSPQVDIHMETPHHEEILSVYRVYHTSIETEETVKCVVTSVLFLAIIALVLIISFTQNPMMS